MAITARRTCQLLLSRDYLVFFLVFLLFPHVFTATLSLLPVMVRFLPYLVPERNQRTFAARANNGHRDLSLHVILNIVDKLVS